jgi:hypothetical protein
LKPARVKRLVASVGSTSKSRSLSSSSVPVNTDPKTRVALQAVAAGKLA